MKLKIKEDSVLILKTNKKIEFDALVCESNKYTYIIVETDIKNDDIQDKLIALEKAIWKYNIEKEYKENK